jgi:SAM-dependent methyltransferase
MLDFGAGTGWVTEFITKMGFSCTAFDIDHKLESFLSGRINADARINPKLIKFKQGDGHSMPFENETFGHIFCYDTFHHMHDYKKVLSEMYRVLSANGRAIFVEPGARHSKSPETLEFLNSAQLGPDWIERDVILEEIDSIAKDSGFSNGLRVVPLAHPLALQTFSMKDWDKFRSGDINQKNLLTKYLANINYFDRVIFYIEKNEGETQPKNFNKTHFGVISFLHSILKSKLSK